MKNLGYYNFFFFFFRFCVMAKGRRLINLTICDDHSFFSCPLHQIYLCFVGNFVMGFVCKELRCRFNVSIKPVGVIKLIIVCGIMKYTRTMPASNHRVLVAIRLFRPISIVARNLLSVIWNLKTTCVVKVCILRKVSEIALPSLKEKPLVFGILFSACQ